MRGIVSYDSATRSVIINLGRLCCARDADDHRWINFAGKSDGTSVARINHHNTGANGHGQGEACYNSEIIIACRLSNAFPVSHK